MADPQSQLEPPRVVIAPRRPDDDHAPTISSPLNPDAASRNKQPKPIVREQREKKESLKKRESTAARSSAASQQQRDEQRGAFEVPTPMRYTIPTPELSHYNAPKPVVFASHEPNPIFAPDGETELKKSVDHAENKKGYRYHLCVADPAFPHKQYYRQTEIAPFNAKMSVEDSDRNIYFDSSCRLVTNEKGWRMSRANVYAREGSLYYEVKILKGIPADGSITTSDGPSPHVRMGWARREAPLDAPVGFDGYSYAVCDTKFDTMHRSRLGKFLAGKSKKSAPQPDQPLEPLRTRDVVGLLITLPPLALHRKVVAGTYNPAVDFTSTPDPNAPAPDIIRDQIPVPFRGNVYFENGEYQPTKPMIQYSDRAPVNDVRPHANHEDAPLRSLPGSSIKVYKNGELVGTAFDNLMAFLPPASAPAAAPGVRQGLDDGSLGYYPAISVFFGGVAETNFGPDFWCPPGDLELGGAPREAGGGATGDESIMRPRGIWERYSEQIAEDVVWDIIDEAAFFVQDGGYNATAGGVAGGNTVSARGNLQDE